MPSPPAPSGLHLLYDYTNHFHAFIFLHPGIPTKIFFLTFFPIPFWSNICRGCPQYMSKHSWLCLSNFIYRLLSLSQSLPVEIPPYSPCPLSLSIFKDRKVFKSAHHYFFPHIIEKTLRILLSISVTLVIHSAAETGSNAYSTFTAS